MDAHPTGEGETLASGALAAARTFAEQPTIYDVARVAGVSVGTVSKAINGRGALRAETRERVRAAATSLGFRPNDLAHSIVRRRSFTVGLLTTDSYGRFSNPLMMGVEDALGPAEILVFLCDARDDPAREQRYVEALRSKRVDGVIVTARRTDPRPPIDLDNAPIPVVYAYAQAAEPGALSIVPDEVQGARLAIERLLGGGRRRFAHITGPGRFEAVRLRELGMRQTLTDRAIALPDSHVLSGPWQEAWGYSAANLLLDTDPLIDAIFCGSDQLARGAADGLRERGARVPDDVALVGFDNWEIIAAATRPPLTTVDMCLHDLGRAAGQKLLAMIGGDRESGVVRLPCRLVVRDSCGAGGDH